MGCLNACLNTCLTNWIYFVEHVHYRVTDSLTVFSLLVVHEYVWYPDRLGARVDGFNSAILERIPLEKRIVPFLSGGKTKLCYSQCDSDSVYFVVQCTQG